MKFLFISEAGDGMGIAHRVKEEGNEVALWVRDEDGQRRGRGLVPQLSDWTFTPDLDTIIVADCTGSGHFLDMLRSAGYRVCCGSALADRLESDRLYSFEVMKECGIKTPPFKQFEDWDAAEEYIREHEERLVFKPCGGLSGNLPSYVSSDSADLLGMLPYFRGRFHGKPEFVLQDFVPGIDVSTEGYFDGDRFIRPFNHTLETKHLMADDDGPSGGCTGNVVWFDEDPLCEELLKIEDFLRENNYGPGPIDLNGLVDEGGKIWGLEFTPRFGYDATPTLYYESTNGDVGEFLSNLATRQVSEYPFLSGYGAGIRISVKPWPSEEHPGPEGIPVRGLRGQDKEHFYPFDVMLDEEKQLVTCGAWGIVGVCGGHGGTIESAFEAADKLADKIQVPDKQKRNDLSEVFKKRYNKAARFLEVSA